MKTIFARISKIKLLFLIVVNACGPLAGLLNAAVVRVENSPNGWELKVDGVRYFIKGVTYNPDRIGQDPAQSTLSDWMYYDFNSNGKNDPAYDAYVDINLNNIRDADEPEVGDFSLLKDMGANTIRLYHHASTASSVVPGYGGNPSTLLQFNHLPNKALLRDLYSTYGIRVAMGDFFGAYTIGSGASFVDGTDYTDPDQRARMLNSVRQMVMDFKDEEFLLLYILGNENNLALTSTNASQFPVEYAQLVNEAAALIHQLDPNHPVVVSQGDLGLINALAIHAPQVDVFGSNVYRGLGFGPFFQEVRTIYNRPVLLTEYGDLNPVIANGNIDQARQAQYHQANWGQIERNGVGGGQQGNAIGGFAHGWMDVWWQDGSGDQHNLGVNNINNEWHGIFGQANSGQSPFVRQKRQVYDVYRSLWTVGKSTLTVQNAQVNLIRWVWTSALNAKSYALCNTAGGAIALNISSTTLFFDEGNLTPNTLYSRRLKAINGYTSAVSDVIAKYTLAAVPGNLIATNISSTSLRVSWSANGNPAGTDYDVMSTRLNTGQVSQFRTSQTSFDLVGLSSGTEYAVRVRAVNKENVATAYSSTVTVKTAAVQVCPCYDVNGDSHITPIDVLVVVNYLNQFGSGPTPAGKENLDVNRDGFIVPRDVLLIVNYLNRFGASIAPFDLPGDKKTFPNLFRPLQGEKVTLVYRALEPALSELKILDQRGGVVQSVQGDALWAGDHLIEWDGRSSDGEMSPSGVYRYVVRCGNQITKGKILLLK